VKRALAVILLALSAPVEASGQEGPLLDQRIASSSAAAQALQGDLDGAWQLTDLAGHPLFSFEIVDPAGPRPRLEAAWRLPMAQAAVDGSGTADIVQPTPTTLRINLARPGRSVRIDLSRSREGTWTGRLNEDGQALRVVLHRGPS